MGQSKVLVPRGRAMTRIRDHKSGFHWTVGFSTLLVFLAGEQVLKMKDAVSVWDFDKSIAHLLHRGSQVAEDHVSRAFVGAGLTPRQFTVLISVAKDPNASQTELVRATGVDRSTLADIVRRLVEAGLLQRRRTREDARAYAVRLTPKAIELIEQLSAKAAHAEQSLLGALSEEDRSHFLALLRKLIEGQGTVADQRLSSMNKEMPNGFLPRS